MIFLCCMPKNCVIVLQPKFCNLFIFCDSNFSVGSKSSGVKVVEFV